METTSEAVTDDPITIDTNPSLQESNLDKTIAEMVAVGENKKTISTITSLGILFS